MRTRLGLLDLIVGGIILLVGMSVVIVSRQRAAQAARELKCVNNLVGIGRLAEVYRKNGFDEDSYHLPYELGAAWHQRLIERVCAEADTSLFQCPFEGCPPELGIDYRGPAGNVNVASNYRLHDAMAGDRVYNHGDPAKYGVNALTKGYQVIKLTPDDGPRWAQYLQGTRD